jgi:hypothetical protein
MMMKSTWLNDARKIISDRREICVRIVLAIAVSGLRTALYKNRPIRAWPYRLRCGEGYVFGETTHDPGAAAELKN